MPARSQASRCLGFARRQPAAWIAALAEFALLRRGILLRPEVLIRHQAGKRHEHEDQKAAEISTAATATAAATLRLKIRIANFGQSNFLSLRSSAPAGRRSFYGNGSWGTRLAGHRRRHKIEPPTAKRITAQQSPKSQRRSAQRTMRGDRDRCILGACRQIAASTRSAKRMHRRRQPAAIELENGKQDSSHDAGSALAAGLAALCAARAASAFACPRIRRISASSFENSMVSTERCGCRIKSQPAGSNST